MHGPAPRRPHASVDTALRDLGSRQHGIVDITSILALGIHRNSIDRRVAEGLLVRCYRGIYRFASAVPTDTQRIAAARLAAFPHAVAVGRSAAVLHGLNVAFALDIGVAPGLTRSLPGVTIHRRRMDAVELTTVRAIPATTLARTVFDLTTILPADPMAAVVDEVLARRMIGRDALLRATALRAGHVGAQRIRQLLDDRPRGALHRSQSERRVAAIFIRKDSDAYSSS